MKKWFCVVLSVLLLTVSMAMALPGFAAEAEYTPAQVEAQLRQLEGTTALSWENFWKNGSFACSKGTMRETEVIEGTGLFARYLSYDLEDKGTSGNNDIQVRLRDTSGAYGLQGSIAADDVMMLHLIVRATHDDADKPMKMHMSLYSNAAGGSSKAPTTGLSTTAANAEEIPSVWTEYYIPMQAHDTYAPDIYVMFLGAGGTGTLDLACLEIINYGKSTTYETLPKAQFDLTDYSLEGRTVLYHDTFAYRAKTSGNGASSAMTFTHVVGDSDSMFADYFQVKVDSITTSGTGYYKQRQVRLANDSGITGNMKAGDTVLIHMIARSHTEDGSDSHFQMALWGSESTSTAAIPALTKTAVPSQWTEYYIPVTAGSTDPKSFVMFVGYEVHTLDIAMLEILDYNNADISTLPSGQSTVIEAGYGAEYDFYSAFEGEETAVDLEGLTSAKKLTGINAISLAGAGIDSFQASDMLLYSFVMKAESASTPVTITIGSTEVTYYVPVQWTRYYMPIETAALGTVTITGDVLLAEAKFVNYKSTSIENMAQLSGPWLLEDFEDIALPEKGVATGGTKDMVKSGSFVYSIGSGNFVVTDVTDPSNPVIRGKLSGLGSAIRQMDLCASGEDVFVTSRQNGAFIINVSDPDAPYVRSQYDSIEMATGMCVYENYAFICNRQYGVEMVDISDLDNPTHVANIYTNGTVQSCTVLDGILYCGQWNECCVSMYDVTDPDDPKYINQVPLNGKGDGMTVSKLDGKVYLYAATGQHHSQKVTDTSSQAKLNFGQGNGMDIFDITDPMNPQWLSTTNIDGRYYYASEDFWDVKVSVDPQGNRYAYYMDTYNGVYVFNVNDPAAPVRLAHITVQIPAFSGSHFTLSHSGRDTILPYDQSQYAQDAIASIYVEEGVIYLAGNKTGVHIWQNDSFLYDTEEHAVTVPIVDGEGSLYDFDGSEYEGFFSYDSDTQFYAVAVNDGKVYAAAGSAGVLVFDQATMTLEATLKTQGAAMDIVYYDGRIYVAERTGGLGVYTIEADGSFTEYLRYTDGQNTIRGVRLSPKGRFAVVQISSNDIHVVNLEDPTAPTKVANSHAATHLYHRNLASVGQYVVAWACSGNEYWYDFGENDDYETPVMVRKVNSSATHMRGGIVAYGDGMVISVHNNGYRVYDPMDTSKEPRSYALHTIDGVTLAGKPYNYNDQLLILSNRIDGVLQIVDIRDVNDPKMLASIDVAGNPDQAMMDGDWLYVPMGYQGLFRFALSGFMTAQANVDGEATGYMTLQEAIDATNGGYVKLMGNVTEDVEITGDVCLDLNGNDMNGNIAGTGKLYLVDSATDDFEGRYGKLTGTVEVTVETFAEMGGKTYLVVNEDGVYSAHCYDVKLTHVSLDPGNDALGYKAQLFGDEILCKYVTGFGFNLWVDGGSVKTYSKDFDGSKVLTLRLKNIMANGGGEMAVGGNAFITFSVEDKTVTSADYSTSMKQVLQTVNERFDSYSTAQKNAVKALATKFESAMSDWDISKILTWTNET